MLKMIPLLFLLQAAPAASPEDGPSVKYELWKGSDDGLTNRVFGEVVAFNKSRQSCAAERPCEKLSLLIPTAVTLLEGGYKARFDVEIYRDLSDRSKPVRKFTVECDLKVNCGEKVFAGLP
jgi:hypothetical protein